MYRLDSMEAGTEWGDLAHTGKEGETAEGDRSGIEARNEELIRVWRSYPLL